MRIRLPVDITVGLIAVIALAIALPSLTWTERVIFQFGGQELNLRVALYFAAAAVAGAASAVVALRHPDARPRWMLVAVAFGAWLLLTATVAGQPAREFLPTVVRWILYLAALHLGWAAAVDLRERPIDLTPGWPERAILLLALSTAAIPIVAALIELLTGSAPILNGAPRLSGTMRGHPAAYSLVLTSCALLAIPSALGPLPRRSRLLIWGFVTLSIGLILFTYTRLTLLLVLAASTACAAALGRSRREIVTRLAIGAALSAVLVLAAFPFFEARVSQTSVVVIGGGGSGQTPGPGASAIPETGETVIEVDNSTLLRLQISRRVVDYIVRSPIVGHGPGSFDRLYEADTGKARVAAHDDLALMAVETGLPGLALYVGLLAVIGWHLRPGLWRSRAAARIGVASGTALAAMTLGATFHNPGYFPEVSLLPFLIAGMATGFLNVGHEP